jgi:gamma-glutamylcyclotransferase (GGCT)/AIG2-like uncharacterized protein YtfP
MPPDSSNADPRPETPLTAERRLFVYDTLLSGERDHDLLRGATLVIRTKTEAAFHLVDLGAYGGLVPGGHTAVAGEVYAVDRATCAAIDVRREVPILFQRYAVRLDDGTLADAYVLTPDQVRGRRRIASGDWRSRFAAAVPTTRHAWSEWARRRDR